MSTGNEKILTAEQEMALRKPIDDYVGGIQEKVNALRADGTDKVVSLQNKIDSLKRDKSRSKAENKASIAKLQGEVTKAKEVESANKDEISKLIADAESYLKEHFDKEYYAPICESAKYEKVAAKEAYDAKLAELKKEHEAELAKLTDHKEIKDEKDDPSMTETWKSKKYI